MAIDNNQYTPLPPPQDLNGVPLYLNNELLNLSRFLNSFKEESNGGLFPGDNISELVNDVGYLVGPLGLTDLSDVITPLTPSSGEVLTFTGSVWEPMAIAGDEDWGLVTSLATSFDDYGSIV